MMIFKRKGKLKWNVVNLASIIFIFVALTLCSCSKMTAPQEKHVNDRDDIKNESTCLDAVRMELGPDGQIIKYGHLIGEESIEAIAYARIKKFKQNSEGMPISKLVVLQKNNSHWDVILIASKEIRNPSGYVGLDFIDDTQEDPGFRVLFSDQRMDGVRAFVILLSYIESNGETEGIPVEISWNKAVSRFQEFSINEAPEGFKPEIKNPPHHLKGMN